MNRKTKKIILLLVTVLAAVAAAIGYSIYNKGPVDVKSSDAISISAVSLYETYKNDSATAQQSFSGKIIIVSGEISDTTSNLQHQKIVLLKTKESSAFINCTMEETGNNIHAGNSINIKGICSGIGEADADLGISGDVYLTRCYLIK